jgi:hypothetical protein
MEHSDLWHLPVLSTTLWSISSYQSGIMKMEMRRHANSRVSLTSTNWLWHSTECYLAYNKQETVTIIYYYYIEIGSLIIEDFMLKSSKGSCRFVFQYPEMNFYEDSRTL